MTKELTEIWITSYALSTGIKKSMAEVSGNAAIVQDKDSTHWASFYHKDEWHLTESEANKRVLEMIARKRISIQKQLCKLDKLEAKIKSHENI